MRAECNPARLTRADPEGGAAPDVDDGIRLDEPGDSPGEKEIEQLGRRRRTTGDDVEIVRRYRVVVGLLNQDPAPDRANVERRAPVASVAVAVAVGGWLLGLPGDEDPHPRLRGEGRRRIRAGDGGRDDHLHELALQHRPREPAVERPVERDDPPNAEVGSVRNARSYASPADAATAAPHGFACLTMTQAGMAPSARTHCRAASASAMLLNESGFP